jgi:hypothetical protein
MTTDQRREVWAIAAWFTFLLGLHGLFFHSLPTMVIAGLGGSAAGGVGSGIGRSVVAGLVLEGPAVVLIAICLAAALRVVFSRRPAWFALAPLAAVGAVLYCQFSSFAGLWTLVQ